MLVTGAGGYIGTTLVPLLAERGYRVRALDRFFFGRELLPANDRVEVVQEDVRKLGPEHLEGVDHVIDLVALSNDPTGERFQEATWQINHEARARTAELARRGDVRRYVLPSSCSVYGRQAGEEPADETAEPNPLTTYAEANLAAERDVLACAGEDLCVVVLRQATVFGYSPRMRFDLAINGMTEGAWRTGKLPLMRDGSQWRPMVHVRDTADAQQFMLEADREAVNGEVFNVGSAEGNYRIGPLGHEVAEAVPREVEIEWYGDPDDRSYRAAFEKIEALGWRAGRSARDGVLEICEALEEGRTEKTACTQTLDWYEELTRWHQIVRDVEMYGGMVEI